MGAGVYTVYTGAVSYRYIQLYTHAGTGAVSYRYIQVHIHAGTGAVSTFTGADQWLRSRSNLRMHVHFTTVGERLPLLLIDGTP